MKVFNVNDKIYCQKFVGELRIKYIVDKNNQLSLSLPKDKIKYLICLNKEGIAKQVNIEEAITEGEM
jgi:hypothetical protein